MLSQLFQIVGSYLDVLLFLAGGIFAVVAPQKLVGKSTDDGTKKKVKWMRIAGSLLIVSAIGSLALKLTS